MKRFISLDHKAPEIVTPFLKWAGGKRWLVACRPELFPKKFNNYYEPFVGSGAVFFYLSPKKSIISDANKELIDTYKVLRDDWPSVLRELNRHHKNHSEDYYYEVRSSMQCLPYKSAARFIYLNRTCWNGLYRVNLKGEFNVPIGTKTNVVLDTDNFEAVSRVLKRTLIKNEDFEAIIDKSKNNDLLFVDPPYTVKHKFNGFVKYNEKLFSWDDQVRLSDAIKRAASRGVKVILTNADHESVIDLYDCSFFNVSRISRQSVIASEGSRRGECTELIVTANIHD